MNEMVKVHPVFRLNQKNKWDVTLSLQGYKHR